MNDRTIELQMPQRKRTRLSPEVRREQLLDCAREIILAQGFASLTMEAVAETADVSNPLVYKYFPSKLALLQNLLVREFLRFHSETQERLRQTTNFEDFVRISVTANFDEVANGNLLAILRSQPDIEQGLDLFALGREAGLGDLLVDRIVEAFPVSRKQATKLAVFGSGASQSAARHWRRFGGNRERLIDDVIEFIMQGMKIYV